MPISGNPNHRGDLIVTFEIEFPDELSLEKKKQIVKLLKAA
jgi:DnaJ-class molecular chaperone